MTVPSRSKADRSELNRFNRHAAKIRFAFLPFEGTALVETRSDQTSLFSGVRHCWCLRFQVSASIMAIDVCGFGAEPTVLPDALTKQNHRNLLQVTREFATLAVVQSSGSDTLHARVRRSGTSVQHKKCILFTVCANKY